MKLLRRWKIVTVALFTSAFGIILLMKTKHHYPIPEEKNKGIHMLQYANNITAKKSSLKQQEEIPIIVASCQDTSRRPLGFRILKSNYTNELRLLNVLLKSAAMLTSRKLHFIIITNHDRPFNFTNQWPTRYKQKVRITTRQIWYPENYKDELATYGTGMCQTVKLFLHEMFPNLECILFMDADMIFFRDPVEVYSICNYLKESHIVAAMPDANGYNRELSVMSSGYGLNGGLIIMNITKMRSLPFNLTEKFLSIYNDKIYSDASDQGILNVFFAEYPDTILWFPCNINFFQIKCKPDVWCHEAAVNGVSILHGTSNSFFVNPLFHAIFGIFERYNLNYFTKKNLAEKVTYVIRKRHYSSDVLCSQVTIFDKMLLKHILRNSSSITS